MPQPAAPTPTPQEILSSLAASEGTTLAALQANAKRKRYNLNVTLAITESGTDKPYFDNEVKWADIGYAHMTIIEGALLEILNKLQKVDEIVAGAPVPTTPPAQP